MTFISDSLKQKIWEKAQAIPNYNPDIWRQDFAGAWIRKDLYGSESDFGWEIDHLKPVSQGGSDDLINLMPMHWQNNRHKSDNYPFFYSIISSEENRNIRKEKSWKVK